MDSNLRILAEKVNDVAREMESRMFDADSVARRIVLNQLLLTKIHLLNTHLLTLRALFLSCKEQKLSHLAVPTNDLSLILKKESVLLSRKNTKFLFAAENVEINIIYCVEVCVCSLAFL